LANPYWGAQYLDWQVNNGDGVTINPSSNLRCDDFIRAVLAPGSTAAGVTRYLKGGVMDMVTSDISRHDAVFGTASWNTMPVQPYPGGWLLNAGATGNTTEYTAGRAGDDHYLSIAAGGTRDSIDGRAAQRLIVLCLTSLLDPAWDIPVEQNGTTTLRTIPLREEIDAIARVLALYVTEPTTKGQRLGTFGWLGQASTLPPWVVDSAFTGYWMMAVELWHLVNSGANYAAYYPIGSW
jgi:hypothetical protein